MTFVFTRGVQDNTDVTDQENDGEERWQLET